MNKIASLIIMISLISCGKIESQTNSTKLPSASPNIQKVKVLNFATFHMRATSDANSVEFDENDKKNQEEAKKVAQMISKFKPTIICVEIPPSEEADLNAEYQKYISNPKEGSSYSGEVRLIAFEVGRISKVPKLYAIDHKMAYNYNIGNEITNAIDSNTLKEFYSNPFKFYPELNVNQDKLSLLEKLSLGNTPKCLDFLINVNADLLTYIGTENNFEGADEAAKYYHRNLRIYSNLNRIPVTKEDRIFILYGGSHTAFLNEFMKRSPKYEVVNTMDYLD